MVISALIPAARAQQPAPAPATPTVAATQPAPAEPPLVTVDDVRKRLDGGAKILIVDARGAIDGDMVKGATHVPFGSVDAWAKDVAKDTVIVTYCACPTEGGSKAVAGRLLALGFKNVAALKGGINAWKNAGLPTDVVHVAAQ